MIEDIAEFTCGGGGKQSESTEIVEVCVGDEADWDRSILETFRSRLATREDFSVALMLDVGGYEWGLLLDLTDAELNKIATIDMAMDFCSTSHSFQSISQVRCRTIELIPLIQSLLNL